MRQLLEMRLGPSAPRIKPGVNITPVALSFLRLILSVTVFYNLFYNYPKLSSLDTKSGKPPNLARLSLSTLCGDRFKTRLLLRLHLLEEDILFRMGLPGDGVEHIDWLGDQVSEVSPSDVNRPVGVVTL